MALPLKASRTCTEMAKVLARLLPGSGSQLWKGHVSFQTLTRDVGVGDFWPTGTKQPAVAILLERTLEFRPMLFEMLVLSIIRAGMKNLQKSGDSIAAVEIRTLNGLLLELGFKFPELWDPAFLAGLESPGQARASEAVERELQTSKVRAGRQWEESKKLDDLRSSFYELCRWSDRNAAGLAFEKVLNGLFELSGLKPREPFRIVGEQIDGSLELDREIYLVEAKWEAEKLSEAPLLVFLGKVTGKSAFTRGIFIALNGCTETARTAITTGKQAHFFGMDGYDLTVVLEGKLSLPELLRGKQRKLAEEGRVFVSAREFI